VMDRLVCPRCDKKNPNWESYVDSELERSELMSIGIRLVCSVCGRSRVFIKHDRELYKVVGSLSVVHGIDEYFRSKFRSGFR